MGYIPGQRGEEVVVAERKYSGESVTGVESKGLKRGAEPVTNELVPNFQLSSYIDS